MLIIRFSFSFIVVVVFIWCSRWVLVFRYSIVVNVIGMFGIVSMFSVVDSGINRVRLLVCYFVIVLN